MVASSFHEVKRNFADEPLKTYENVRKITVSQGHENATGADPKTIQKISFTET